MIDRVIRLWREDFKSWFDRQDRSILLLTSIKNLMATSALLTRYIILPGFGLVLLFFVVGVLVGLGTSTWFHIFITSFFWIWVLVMSYCAMLAVRPSTERKDRRYFLQYAMRWDAWLWVMVLVLAYLVFPFVFGVLYDSFLIFYLFFLFDMECDGRSMRLAWRNTGCFVMSFFPSFFLIMLAYVATNYLFFAVSRTMLAYFLQGDQFGIIGGFLWVAGWLISFILVIAALALAANYYTRTKHRYHSLFLWE